MCACVVMDLPVQLLTLGCGAHDSHCPPKDRQTRERPEDKGVTDTTDTSSTGVCLGAFQQDHFFSLSQTMSRNMYLFSVLLPFFVVDK